MALSRRNRDERQYVWFSPLRKPSYGDAMLVKVFQKSRKTAQREYASLLVFNKRPKTSWTTSNPLFSSSSSFCIRILESTLAWVALLSRPQKDRDMSGSVCCQNIHHNGEMVGVLGSIAAEIENKSTYERAVLPGHY
jgi:hypothetical protein